jgi:dipeptidyl-peptidase 4
LTDAQKVYRSYLERHKLVSGGAVPATWVGSTLCYLEKAAGEDAIRCVDLNTGDTDHRLDVAVARAALAAVIGDEPLRRGSDRFRSPLSVLEIPAASPSAPSPMTWKRATYITDVQDVAACASPDGAWVAGVIDNNIVLRSTRHGGQRKLTDNGTAECFWDMESQHAKYIPGNTLTPAASVGVSPWSLDGLTLCAYRRDVSGVYQSPRIRWSGPFQEVDYSRLQKAGTTIDRIQPMFVDVRSLRQTPVLVGETADRYIQWLGWRPDGSEALLIVYDRNFKRVEILAARRDSGAVRSLITENTTTFVKNYEALWLGEHGFRLLPDGSGFLWLSTRDGWNHIYRYDISGKLIEQLTSGAWPVYRVEYVGGDGFVYFIAASDTSRPYDVHVCRVPLGGGSVEQLTREEGLHAPAFAPDGAAFLDYHSTVDRPLRTDLVRADGTLLRTLSKMDITDLCAVGYTPAEEFTVKAADGTTDLWGVLYKPFDFDACRSYPVIEFIYGGPNIAAERFFSIRDSQYGNWPWALAQLGYIVVCVDARGTPGRSKSFFDVICNDWTAGVADHSAAIRQLCERYRWMDAERVGITGHSWGGYFATCALIQHPQTYHAAVSYEGAYDPWDGIQYEIFLDLPQTNRAAYDRADLTKQAGNLRGKFMMITGTAYCHTTSGAMRMTRALIEAGIDHELVVAPDAGHNFIGAEESYLLRKLTGWLERHVKDREQTQLDGTRKSS